MVSSHVKSALVSLMTALIVLGLTNFLYWQPQLELLRQEAVGNQLQFFLTTTDGWSVKDTTACAVVHVGTSFHFKITNGSKRPVQTLTSKFEATNWNGGSVGANETHILGPGDSFNVTFYWWKSSLVSSGNQAQFTFSIVTVEIGAQSDTFCVAYA